VAKSKEKEDNERTRSASRPFVKGKNGFGSVNSSDVEARWRVSKGARWIADKMDNRIDRRYRKSDARHSRRWRECDGVSVELDDIS
jgi:hypothetical protein